VLPFGEADFLDDVVDVCNDAFNDDMRIGVLRFLEEFRQRFFGTVALLFVVGFFLSFDDFLGDFEDLLRASRILRPRSPSWVRWASSTITMMLERSLSLPPASPNL
jgi:hypothetical protein